MRRQLALLIAASIAIAVAVVAPAGRAAAAEPATPATSPDASIAFPAIPGDAGTFALKDGATITGTLVALGADGAVVELTDGTQLRFPAGSITGVKELRRAADDSTLLGVLRRDGTKVKGRLAARTPTELTLRTEEGDRVAVPLASVRTLTYEGLSPTGPTWARAPADGPARNRTMFAPTAFLLDPGELQLSFTGIVQPTFSAGILPFLGASAWTVIPIMQAKGWPATGALSVNAGLSPLSWLHLMAGVQGVVESGGATVAPIVAVSFGGPRAYGNLALAPTPVGAARGGQFEKGALAASGGVAVAEWAMLLAEGWLGKAMDGSASTQLGAAVRVHWSIVGAEVGGLWQSGGGGWMFASVIVDMNPFGGRDDK